LDNYALSRDRAQAYFLGFDQQAIIDAWGLQWDEESLYVHFLSRPYAIHRKTGRITRCFDGKQAGFNEVLSIFDFLCHESPEKTVSGRFAPVNSLKGGPKAGGVSTDFHTDAAQRFDRDPEGFARACQALGGTKVSMGDLGFQIPVFADVSVILKFYRSDEEFPASLTLLWDDHTLSFIYYETVFYIAGFLLASIQERMEEMPDGSFGREKL